MSDLFIDRGADISPCERYRYLLWRRWDTSRPRLIFIMLNPSTADAETDDATIRVCMGRARRMRFGGIRVLNLFAWRATDPSELATAPDPIGPENDSYLERYTSEMEFPTGSREVTIAAWGDGGLLGGRYRDALGIICGDMGRSLHALGLTIKGQPKHPLRIPNSTPPSFWMDRKRYFETPP